MATLISTNVTGTLDILNSSSNIKLLRLSHPTSSTTDGGFLGFNSDGTTNNMVVTLGVQYSSNYYNVINIKRDTRNVGIGTADPDERLHVSEASGGATRIKLDSLDASRNNFIGIVNHDNLILAADHDNEGGDSSIRMSVDGSERVRIASNGKVGIGTATPRALLDVRTTVDGDSFPSRITSTDGSFTDEQKLGIEFAQNTVVLNQFYSKYDISLGGWGFGFKGYSSGLTDELFTIGANGNIGIGTANPGHGFTVHKSSGAVNTPIAWLHNSGNFANYDGTVISTVNNGSDAEVLHVRTNNTTYNGGTSLMLVRGDGNFGIGTASPTQKLQVGGTTVEDTAIKIDSAANSNANKSWLINATQADALLRIGSENNPTSLVIKGSDGNVGIGTTNPGNYKLKVVGETHSTHFITGYDWTAKTGGLHIGNDGLTTGAVSFYNGSNSSANIYRNSNILYVGARAGVNTAGLAIDVNGNVGIGTATTNVKLAVVGQASFADRKLSLIGLDINSGGTPSYIKIRTKIPFASSSADFTVNIKGFRYGSAQMVDITVGWHYYNNIFYSPSVSSSGAFAPTVKLSAEDWDSSGTKKVCIVLVGPGYWPKLYVDSMYSSAYADSYAAGWTWVDADATGTGNDLSTPSYKSDFGNNFKMLSNGNVGIGIANPSAGLHVVNATEPTVLFESTNAGSSGSRLQLYHNSASPADNDIISNIQMAGEDSSGAKRYAALIQTIAADVNASSVDGDIRFLTYKSDTASEVMRITHDKTVGIGTAVPTSTYKLHVYETIDTGVGILAQNPNTGTSATTSVSLLNNSGSLAGFILPSSNYSAVSSWSNRLVINTDSGISNGIIVRPSAGGFTVSTTGLSNSDLYVENGTGDVGINTPSPGAKLHVIEADTGEAFRIDGASSGFAMIVEGGTSYKTRMRGGVTIGNGYGASTPPANGLIVEGSFGVGTISPNSPLTVQSDASANSIQIYGRASDDSGDIDFYANDTTTRKARIFIDSNGFNISGKASGASNLLIDSSGKVGIGTPSPSYKLDVAGNARVTTDLFVNDQLAVKTTTLAVSNNFHVSSGTTGSASKSSIALVSVADNSTFSSGVAALHVINSGNRGTKGHSSGSDLLRLEFSDTIHTVFDKDGNVIVGNGGDGGGATIRPGGQTSVYALTVDRSGSSGTSVDIWDYNSNSVIIGATSSEKTLTVKAGGNVGIGTPDPKGDLHVSTTGNYTEVIISSVVNATSGSYLRLTEGSNDWGSYGYLGGYIQYDGDDNLIIIGRHNTNGTTLTDDIPAITIKRDNGKVGIGTTNPSNPLHVVSGDNVLATFESTDANATLYLKDSNTTLASTFKRITNDLAILESGGNVGINTITPNSKLQIVGSTSGDSVLRVDGTNGTLFEVVDDLSDSLMSVNDAAGLPVFEVFADNTIIGGRYNKNDFYLQGSSGKIGMGTGSPDATGLTIQDTAGDVNSGVRGVFALKNYAGVVTHRFSSSYVTGFASQAYATYWLYNPVNSSTAFYVRADNTLGPRLQLNNSSGSSSVYLSTYAGIPTAFNVGQENIDFNVRGDSDINLFYVDAGSDKVGITTSTPRVRLDLGANGVTHMRWGSWSELGEESSHNSLLLGNNVYVDGNASKVRSTSGDGYRAIKMKYSDGITFHTVNATVNANDALGYERVRISPAGQLLISDGSVGAPSLSFINDTNTGMWRAGSDQLRLVTGGSDAITINGSQAICLPGYASSPPTGNRAYFLAIDSSGCVIADSGGGGGTIGDGTITLAAGTGLTGGGSFTTNQTANATITFNATGGGGGSGTVTSVSAAGTVNGLTLTTGNPNDPITGSGTITLGGTLGSIANSALTNSAITINGTSTALGGSIDAIPTGGSAGQVLTKTDGTAYNVSWTNAGTGTVTGTGTVGYITKWETGAKIKDSVIVETSTGSIGIGTDASGTTQKLHVNGGLRVVDGFYDSSGDVGGDGQILSSTGSGTTWIDAGSGSGTVTGTGTAGYISRWKNGTEIENSSVFQNTNGNIGIGEVTNITQKLHVAGNLRVTGGIYDSSGDVGSNGQILSSTASGTNWTDAGTGTVTSVTSATTNQLTINQSSPAPALTIVTGPVADAGTALATGNQIYDFVIGLSYITASSTSALTNKTGSNSQWTNDENYSTTTGTVTGVTSATANQLTINQSSPAPALTIVTGPVADAGTALATGDQIHTFVTDFGYMSHWDLQVNGSSNSEINNSKVVNFAAGAGAAISKGTSAGGFTLTFSLSTSSDYRLKKNISTFNSEAWTKIKNVNLRKFDFDEDAVEVAISSPNTEIHKRPDQYKDNLGFIAHELAKAEINGAVIGDKDAVDENGNFIYQKVNYLELVPVLWGALNEAIFKIETLETKVRELQNK